MKKLLAFLLVAAVALAFGACSNNNTTDPEPTPPPVVTTPVVNYGFEANAEGWTVTGSAQIASVAQSTTAAFAGTGSLAVTCAFTDDTGGEIGKNYASAPIDLTGKWVYVRIWVPANFPPYGGAAVYTKSGAASTWQQGAYRTLIPGQWNELHLEGSAAATPADIRELGVKIAPSGGYSGSFTGTLYVDEVVSSSTAFSDTGTFDFTLNQTALFNFNVEDTTALAIAAKSWSSGTMTLPAVFNSTDIKGVIMRRPDSTLNLNNATIRIIMNIGTLATADPSTPYGLQIYLKEGDSWTWRSASWVNLDLAGNQTYEWTGVTFNDVKEIGFQIGKGGDVGSYSADWSGNIVVDSISIINN